MRAQRRAAALVLFAGAGLTAVALPATPITPAAHAAPADPAAPPTGAEALAALLGNPEAVAALLPAAGPGPAAAAIAGTDGLDPQLAAAYSSASAEAQAQGVYLYINSGHRSPAEQQALWEDGLATYGTPEETRKWVLPPEESTHVSGQAIDVGPRAGAQWLEDNGYRWGLCRTFDNEWWHFERVTSPGAPCPARVPDASLRTAPTRPGDNPAVPPILPTLPPELQSLLDMLGSSVR